MFRWLICNLFHRDYWIFGRGADQDFSYDYYGRCPKCGRYWNALNHHPNMWGR
jgi:hypothetical protein